MEPQLNNFNPGLKSHDKSALFRTYSQTNRAVSKLFINEQNCSALNQYWISTLNYLKISEQHCLSAVQLWKPISQSKKIQRCSALKSNFLGAKKKLALNSAVSALIFSESALVVSESELLFSESAVNANFLREKNSSLLPWKLDLKHIILEMDTADCLWGRADQRWNHLIQDYWIRGRNNFWHSSLVFREKNKRKLIFWHKYGHEEVLKLQHLIQLKHQHNWVNNKNTMNFA